MSCTSGVEVQDSIAKHVTDARKLVETQLSTLHDYFEKRAGVMQKFQDDVSKSTSTSSGEVLHYAVVLL